MDQPEHERLATKYENIAALLSPNSPGPLDKAYYLAKAAEHRAAAQDPKSDAAHSDSTRIKGILEYASERRQADYIQPPRISQTVRMHAGLALAVLGDRGKDIHRAYGIWATIRQRRMWFYRADLVRVYCEATGKAPRSVERWLDAGEGTLFIFGGKGDQRTVTIRGKDAVFATYNLSKPGRVLAVNSDQLLGGLQKLRATLYSGWLNGKKNKWASRETIKKLTSIRDRSQRNYDQANKQKKQYCFVTNWKCENGENRQVPNVYHAVNMAAEDIKHKRRFSLYIPESKAQWSPFDGTGIKANDKRRILFDNPNAAVRAVKRRKQNGDIGQCFALLAGRSPKGHNLLRAFDYQDNVDLGSVFDSMPLSF